MTKKLLVLSLVLLSLSVNAQIPGRLDSLRARVFTRLQLPTAGTAATTTAIVGQAIKDAQLPVCWDFDALVKFDTVTIYGGPEGAALNSDFLRVVGVFRIKGPTIRIPMIEVDLATLFEKAGGLASYSYRPGDSLQPRYFAIAGDRILTAPKSNLPSPRTDSLFIVYNAFAGRLDSVADSTTIDPGFREVLIIKACQIVQGIRFGLNAPETMAFANEYAEHMKRYGRNVK